LSEAQPSGNQARHPDAPGPGQERRPDAGKGYPRACLVVLDGWGLAPEGPCNAVGQADTPVFDKLWAEHATTTLIAMGESVGLPAGQMGNSEVGHLNLGAGAIVPQDLARIDKAVADGRLAENETLRAAMHAAPRVHLIGLVSDGGVHSSDRHLKGLIELAARWEVPDLVIHAFTDGRDTLPTSGAGFVADVERCCREAGAGRIGSVVGRYFAMDRDRRWDRAQKAYDLLVHGRAEHRAETGEAAVKAAYARDETDEFITTTTVGAEARIRPGDSVIGFNFRPDRMRQITRSLADPGFGEIDRGGAGIIERYATMTQYEEDWPYPLVFPPHRPAITMAQVIAGRDLRQLHVAETEKYPHVTYFFNGGEEDPYPGEVRELVPSPRDVPTYDHKPEMSAREATDAFVRHWNEDDFAFAIINLANADMVGHTGSIPAAIKAVETVDECLARIVEAVHGKGGACLITADHGNADNMLEPDGSPNTQHSLNPVPVIVTAEGAELDGEGILADVAPTLLAILEIEQPDEMTGRSLLA
jgi:2,3-bisphosphoglycerate-independent phosphoglycerate mutase